MTEYQNYSLQKTISNIEQKVDHGDYQDDDDDDVIPTAAAEMGAGLVVYQISGICFSFITKFLGILRTNYINITQCRGPNQISQSQIARYARGIGPTVSRAE